VGNPTGSPVLLVHGGPGSRLLDPDEDATAAAGVRLLTVDRPGYGGSDARPDPTLLGWADDVQALADRLGLDRFAVVGFSAGGGYALACAASMPERIGAVGLARPDVRDALTRMFREGARQGVGGLVDDWIALSLPWGFALAEVKMPVAVRHGELDHLVGPAHAHYFSAALPSSTLVLYPQDGHLLLLQHWGEILAAVTAGAPTRDPAAGTTASGS
jgi:pimeloyl-ACP methyl ester carboxylesterase